MKTDIREPHERLQAAADHIRELAGKAESGPWFYDQSNTVHNISVDIAGPLVLADAMFIALFDPILGELIAQLFEGQAAHWATRAIADWDTYRLTPLAAIERHINAAAVPV